jgi:TPP-dependent pyruvate/acetoin dehydrogenase alpha subunit
MLRIRLFEETLADLFANGQLVGVVHLSIGQEATAVGVCSGLEPGDQITTTHREWLKTVGEAVEAGEPLVAVETDKVEATVDAPVSGVLVEILAEPDEDVPVGGKLAYVRPDSSASGT